MISSSKPTNRNSTRTCSISGAEAMRSCSDTGTNSDSLLDGDACGGAACVKASSATIITMMMMMMLLVGAAVRPRTLSGEAIMLQL